MPDKPKGKFETIAEIGFIDRNDTNRLAVTVVETGRNDKTYRSVYVTKQWKPDDSDWRNNKGGLMFRESDREPLMGLLSKAFGAINAEPKPTKPKSSF